MFDWKIDFIGKKPTLKKPILIEGLPGMGNVGKIAVDFLVDVLHAKKFAVMDSIHMPSSVFIGENGLIEIPEISFYYKKLKDNDIIFLVGDFQPIDEPSSHSFCQEIIDFFKSFKGDHIITLGGIGLPEVPEKPKVYLTANNASIKKEYSVKNVKKNIYGVVGPIIGVSGLLLGSSKKNKIDAVSLLAQTFGHPNYVGVKGAREILKVLSTVLKLKIDLKELDDEIKEMESTLKKLSSIQPKKESKPGSDKNINYIG